MSKLCIPLAQKSIQLLLDSIIAAEQAGAEAIEIWLGELTDIDCAKIRSQTALPLIANCKGPKEKGTFDGDDQQKLQILLAAAKAGFEYVDFDYSTPQNLIDQFRQEKPDACQLILSAHYFNGTPGLPALTRIIPQMIAAGAEMVKFAAQPNSLKDVVTMVRLAEKLQSKSIPHIVLSMSELGKATRVLSPLLGNEFTFASLTNETATAPGQISINDLAKTYKILYNK